MEKEIKEKVPMPTSVKVILGMLLVIGIIVFESAVMKTPMDKIMNHLWLIILGVIVLFYSFKSKPKE